MFRTLAAGLLLIFASNTFAADTDYAAELKTRSFQGVQILAIEAALKLKGLPVDKIYGWPGGGLYDDFFQSVGYVFQKGAALAGEAYNYDGHFRLEVVIERPGRNTSIRCDAWVEFKAGTYELHDLETKYCNTEYTFKIRHAIYEGQLFGKLPGYTTERNCLVLAPGTTTEGPNRENCQISYAVPIPDPDEAKYDIKIEDTDIFGLQHN